MTLVQIVLTNQGYAEELAQLLFSIGQHEVLRPPIPDLNLGGVVVMDLNCFCRLEVRPLRPERIVLVANRAADSLSRAWDAGLKSVVYEDDPTRGKDRPVLVVGRDRSTLLGLMLSSQDHHREDPNWVGIGSGSWDYESRASWVRLDRVLDVPEEGIRREGAILEREMFEVVAARLRAEYSWS